MESRTTMHTTFHGQFTLLCSSHFTRGRYVMYLTYCQVMNAWISSSIVQYFLVQRCIIKHKHVTYKRNQEIWLFLPYNRKGRSWNEK